MIAHTGDTIPLTMAAHDAALLEQFLADVWATEVALRDEVEQQQIDVREAVARSAADVRREVAAQVTAANAAIAKMDVW